jgi:purine-cytosine permease-like protein
MNTLKRWMGILCMLIGPAIVVMLVLGAIRNIDPSGKLEVNRPVPWIIIISIFIPVALGLLIFGWYAWKGEYDRLADSSEELS